jgi:hypothetical protein
MCRSQEDQKAHRFHVVFWRHTKMRFSRHWWLQRGFAAVAVTAVTGGATQQLLKQTLAPHELREGDAPPAIIWEPPALPHDSVNFESAEERHLRVVVVTEVKVFVPLSKETG